MILNPAWASACSVAVSAAKRARFGHRRTSRREGGRPRRPDTADVQPPRGQPAIGVIGAQQQAIFRPRREHAIGLGDPAGDQIVDHHPDVAFRPVEMHLAQTAGVAGGVQPRDQTLAGGFLITGGAIDLAGQK